MTARPFGGFTRANVLPFEVKSSAFDGSGFVKCFLKTDPMTCPSSVLVDVSPMSQSHNQHKQLAIVDRVDDAIVAQHLASGLHIVAVLH